MNPIARGYQLFDDGIMYGVNKAVHAYNWTTGGTKDELANNLLTGVAILLSTGQMVKYNAAGLVFMPMYLFGTDLIQRTNTFIGEEERKSMGGGVLNTVVERYKSFCSILGPFFSLVAADDFIHSQRVEHDIGFQIGFGITSMGHGLFGASEYVMRADSLPPRKNAFSRGLDKLKELGESLYREPAVERISVNSVIEGGLI